MKYLVLFAIVVQALAAPQGKPGGNPGPETGNPSGPSGHPNVTGPPPPPPDGSFDTRPHGNGPPASDVIPAPNGGNPPPSQDSPRPANGNPPPSGKAPANGPKPGQPPAGNVRPKRHLNGVKGKPTEKPHVENHTHDFTGSHSHTGTAESHSGEKGHDSRPGKRH